MNSSSPVIRAVLAYVRDLGPEELEALCGSPLREASDGALWAYLLGLAPERLGMLLADGVADAARHRIVLPLDVERDVVAAWQAGDEWGRSLGDTPPAVTRLGQDAADGRWGR